MNLEKRKKERPRKHIKMLPPGGEKAEGSYQTAAGDDFNDTFTAVALSITIQHHRYSVMSNIRPRAQNWSCTDPYVAHWAVLENMKHGTDFGLVTESSTVAVHTSWPK